MKTNLTLNELALHRDEGEEEQHKSVEKENKEEYEIIDGFYIRNI